MPRPLSRRVVGVVVALLAGCMAAACASATPAPRRSAGASAPPTWRGPSPPPVVSALMTGSSQAPVTVVEFGDYQCPDCGRFAREVEPRLRRRYVDTGVVRLVWRDDPIFGERSVRAAIAARAAARQGRFWEYHDALFSRGTRPITAELLRELASRVGLDLTRFDADLRDPALAAAVRADAEFAAGLGVPGTPAFLVNGTPLFGAQPESAFARAIERARAGLSAPQG